MAITEGPDNSATAPSEQPDDLREEMDQRFRAEVNQANILLEWAVATGKEIDEKLVNSVKEGYALLSNLGEVPPDKRAGFEFAYMQLARALSPVTYRTLKATDDRQGRRTFLAPLEWFRKKNICDARVWSKKLWVWTIVLLLAVMVAENFDDYLDLFAPADSQSIQDTADSPAKYYRVSFWLAVILPFLYGGLGACAYLLRSCHRFIHSRTFDSDRIPEYYNRLLLGFLAGGAILLFMTEEGTLIGADTPISAAALAFLAGYSTDFLYTTLERIAGAVLPKEVRQPGSSAGSAAKKSGNS